MRTLQNKLEKLWNDFECEDIICHLLINKHGVKLFRVESLQSYTGDFEDESDDRGRKAIKPNELFKDRLHYVG